ncbi:hypothetical protein BKA61DRAFT_553917 [Leptodontidium sp. MPI-SDFR-AT-0119]|nr:hypothetical protein BKA61DRAFT_553917 [Leptodontidium sp. MPI-SDFR-AT-0119]
MPTSFPPSAQRRAAQACQRCRQQKMKCSGGTDPPCERCAKSNHRCIFETSTTVQPILRWATSNPGAQEEPSVAAGTQYSHSLESLPSLSDCPSVQATSISTPPWPQSQTCSYNKRRRVDDSPATTKRSYSSLPTDDDTPYFAVQGLEDTHSRSALPLTRSVQCPRTPQSDLGMSAPSESSYPPRESLHTCLLEVDIQLPDAEQMFLLFGERIAPFIPTLYATDFSRLPSTPLLVLAAIHSVVRYFPDSSSLRFKTCRILHRLLRNLLFQNLGQQTEEAAETMQGLIILYSCCEATASTVPADGRQQEHLDMLTVRAVIEGYALKMKFGVATQESPKAPLFCLWWLWIYTMGNHSSILHGCSITIGSSAALQRAKRLVEHNISNVRVTALLGEVELCQLWETVLSLPGASDEKINQELQGWSYRWGDFAGKAVEGRGLRFHYHFTRFHLLTRLVDFSCNTPRVTKSSLDAACDFLQCTTHLPPMSKDKLRYLCDFGFVMMAYVCVFILRAIRANVVPLDRTADLHQDVTDVARLMQSFSAKDFARPAIYGRALEKLCAETFKDLQKPGNSTIKQNSTGNGDIFNAIGADRIVRTNQAIPTSESMTTSTELESPLVNVASNLRDLCEEGPYLPQSDDELTNTIAELWGLNSYLSGYDDMMTGVPAIGDYDTSI